MCTGIRTASIAKQHNGVRMRILILQMPNPNTIQVLANELGGILAGA